MESQSMAPPRLVRRRHGRMIAGVCKGVADHFGIDAVLVRIGFVVASFFGGAGVIGYAAAWAFIPEEGDDTSIGERILHERRWGRIAGIVLIAIALSSVARPFWWFGGHAIFAVLLIVAGLYLLTSHPTPPASTPVPDPAPVPDERLSIAEPTEPRNAQTWAEHRRARRRGRRGGLGALTFGALFVGAGVVGLVLASGRTVEPAYVFAGGLIVVGVALVVSTWIGRSFVLIPIGLLLAGLMSVSTLIDVPITGGVGERRVQPLTIADLKDEYHLGIGELRLDLSRLDFERGSVHTIRATLGIGQLRVLLPRDVVAELRGHAGVGDVRFLDDHDGGMKVDRETTLPAAGENPPRLILDLEVGAGQVEVTDASS